MRDEVAACDTAGRSYRASAGRHSRGRGKRTEVYVMRLAKLA